MKRSLRILVLGCLCILMATCASAGTADTLFEAEATLQAGEEPTLFRVWQTEEHTAAWPDDPTFQVQVTPPAGEPYGFVFPSYEGSEASSLMHLLHFVDMNGDGILDVEAMYALGASNITSTYYLYDPADNRLHYSPELGALSNAVYDPEEHIILSQVSDGADRQYYSLFGFREGIPVLLRTACMEACPTEDAYVLRTNVSSIVTGALLLEESVPLDGDDAAVWNAQYERLTRALLENRESDLSSAQP